MMSQSEIISISFQYGAVLLTGRYAYSAKDIFVELIGALPQIKTTLHIPYAMPKRFTEELAEEKAKQLMIELYDDYVLLEKHKAELSAAFDDSKERCRELETEKRELDSQLVELKQRLKDGELSNAAYQQAVTPLKEQKDAILIEMYGFPREKIETIIGRHCCIDNLEACVSELIGKA